MEDFSTRIEKRIMFINSYMAEAKKLMDEASELEKQNKLEKSREILEKLMN